MPSKAKPRSAAELRRLIAVARGQKPATTVLRGGGFLDVFSGQLRDGDVALDAEAGVIVGVSDPYEGEQVEQLSGALIVPGFIDAHVHIESSLMTPARFQQAVLPHGTTSVMWDPHEIANVKGAAGIEWALSASEGLDLDVFVMVPSCVPSTTPELGLETSGATLKAADLAPFRGHPRVLGLAEMMNFPGLLGGDEDVVQKLVDFGGLRRDGHCPGLSGKDLNAYGVAGIHSCHESTTLPEAREKLTKGVAVLIREGSCAKDADTLLPLLDAYTSSALGLCSDDRNPADIAEAGHISCIVEKALVAGHPPADVFRAASHAAARLYGLDDRGAVAPGYLADLVVVRPRAGSDWTSGMRIEAVYKRGRKVDPARLARAAEQRTVASTRRDGDRNLKLAPITLDTLKLGVELGLGAHSPAPRLGIAVADPDTIQARVIGVIPRQILTRSETAKLPVVHGSVAADPSRDILKIAVLERHHRTGRTGLGFVSGFGLKRGAIATSINHDSHNVIAVGSSDAAMVTAVNELLRLDGGIVVVHDDGRKEGLALPLGGLMTDADPAVVTEALHRLKALAKAIGCELEEPFLQLSFLALPVIPSLKITDRGLVDVTRFGLVPVLEMT